MGVGGKQEGGFRIADNMIHNEIIFFLQESDDMSWRIQRTIGNHLATSHLWNVDFE